MLRAGESEWLTLSENSVRFPDNDVVLSPSSQTRKVCEPINGFSCQKLGVLVWAKTGKYPWWPAETCLLAVDELTKHFPPNPLGQQRSAAKETTMVPWLRPKRLKIESSDGDDACDLTLDVHTGPLFRRCANGRRRRGPRRSLFY